MGARTLLVFRGIAVGHLVAGLFALGFVVATPELATPSATAAGVVSAVIVVLSAVGAYRSEWMERFIYSRPRERAILLLVAAVAANAIFPFGYGPLYGWTLAAVATGAGQLRGRGWLAYGLVAALLSLIGAGLSGQLDHLGADRHAGTVLIGSPLGLINAAFFGTCVHKVIQRLRRLELTARQEGERPARLRAALPDVERLQRAAVVLIDDAERVARGLSDASARGLLEGVARSRGAASRLIADGPRADEGAGLRAMLGLQLSSWSHLWTAREMTYVLAVSAAADEIAVPVLEAVQRALVEVLDNVDRHGALGGVVRIDAAVVEDFLVIDLHNDLDPSPRRPTREGTGFGKSSAASALRGVGGTIAFRTEAGRRHCATLTVPLLRAQSAASADELDLRSTNHAAQVSRWLSSAFRSFRRVAALGMLAAAAADLPGSQGRLAAPAAVVAAITAELLLARAGLRGERSGAMRWVIAASATAIAASALMPQADRYQTAVWAALVLVELAWRGGWRWWIGAEALRTTAVVTTMFIPAGEAGLAYSAQVLLPWLFGLGAVAAHRVMRPTFELQQQLGTAAERFSSLQSFARSIAARHSLIAPLGESIDRLPGEHESLRERIDALYREMLVSAADVDKLYPPQVTLRESIEETLEAVLNVPVRCLGFDEILIAPRGFTGAQMDAHARRAGVLDDLAAFAEQHLLDAVEPTVWGDPRLESVTVEATQGDDGALLLLVSTVPLGDVSDAAERQQVLRSASGVTVHFSMRTWSVTIDPQALA